MDQLSLNVGRKQEDQSPCQDTSERAIKESRLLDGFARHRRIRKAASECLDKRWCCINAKGVQSFGNQNLGDGKSGPTAEVDHGGTARERSGPLPHLTHADAGSAATAPASQKLLGDTFVAIRSIYDGLSISVRVRSQQTPSDRYQV